MPKQLPPREIDPARLQLRSFKRRAALLRTWATMIENGAGAVVAQRMRRLADRLSRS